MNYFICASLIGLSLLAACQRDETVKAFGASDKVWRLVELDDTEVGFNATLTFPETGKIAGHAPCNAYSGSMTVPYPWFEAGPLAATRMACPDLSAEAAFFKALGEMSLSEVLGDTLLLSNDAGRTMVFKADG